VTPADSAILHALRQHGRPMRVRVLVRRAGYAPTTVFEALRRLQAEGKVTRYRRGVWRLRVERTPQLPAMVERVEIPPPSEAVTVCVTLGDWWAPVTLRPSGRHEIGRAQHGGQWVRDVPADVGAALVQAALERAA
jgi:DNA-binding Lrp family transcriptional regulator